MNQPTYAFHDERIDAARGRVMREMVYFFTGVTLLYTLVYIGGLWCADVLRWELLITEPAVLLAGGILIAWGELAYPDARRDEMAAAEKGRFFDRAFYIFVCAVALAYCVEVAVSLRVARPNGVLPVGFFPATLMQLGVVFLLLRLKGKRVTLNYSVMDAPGGDYWRRVLWNTLRLGGLCLVFGCIAVAVYLFLGGRDPWEVAGVLLSAVLTWLCLGLAYLALSAAERASDAAERRGRLSVVPLVTFFGYTVCVAALAGVALVAALAFGSLQSAKAAVLISYANLGLGTLSTLLVLFFALYIAAECRGLPAPCGRWLERAGRGYALVGLASLVVTTLQSHVSLYITGVENRFPGYEAIQALAEALVVERQIVSMVILLCGAACLVGGLWSLTGLRRMPRELTATASGVTIVAALLEALRLLLRVITVFASHTILTVADRCLSLLLCAVLCVLLIRLYRTVRLEVEE